MGFLSNRICQDPPENIFGCQRQRGGTTDNPNVAEFLKNTQALRVVNSFCRGLPEEIVVEANTMSTLAKETHHYLREEGFDQVIIQTVISSHAGILLCPALFFSSFYFYYYYCITLFRIIMYHLGNSNYTNVGIYINI